MRKESNTAAILVVSIVGLLLLVALIAVVGGGWYFMARQAVAARRAEIQMQMALQQTMQAQAEADLAKQAAMVDSQPAKNTQVLRIAIDKSGALAIKGQPIERSELHARLKSAEEQDSKVKVEIAATADTRFQLVAELMEQCKEFKDVEVTVVQLP